jgi:uncharacterized protein (TIGR02284 family)
MSESKTDNTELVKTLNHLIVINNDRIDGYEKALAECKEKHPDLKELFNDMIEMSFENKKELEDAVEDAGGVIDTGTTTAGKIHRIWMDIDSAFTGFARHTLLANCETGEDASLKAYQEAIASNIPYQLRDILEVQELRLKSAHDRIKYLRDEEHTHDTRR